MNLTQSLFQAGVQSELDAKQAQTALQTALAEVPAIQQQIGRRPDILYGICVSCTSHTAKKISSPRWEIASISVMYISTFARRLAVDSHGPP